MNDYTARIIHEDRTAQMRREADASRLASPARQRHPTRTLSARIRSLGLVVSRWTERRTDRANLPEAVAITPAE